MNDMQIEFGRKRIKEIAEAWGVTVPQAARMLEGEEYKDFWGWVNADEFLWMKLYPYLIMNRNS